MSKSASGEQRVGTSSRFVLTTYDFVSPDKLPSGLAIAATAAAVAAATAAIAAVAATTAAIAATAKATTAAA